MWENNCSINDVLDLAISMSDEIVIMGHKYIDLDALGSSLGLVKYILDLGKKAYVYVNPNEYNYSVVKAMEILPKDLNKRLIQDDSKLKLGKHSLLIVLDTFKTKTIEDFELFEKFPNTLVLDHHEINGDRLDATLKYIKPGASSMVEIICDYLKSKDYSLDPTISTIMYTGLCIDTNNFDNNTSENTFLASAYLLKNNASIRIKKSLFQEKKEDILNRSRLLKRSITVGDNIMVCVLDSNIYSPADLSKISNELLKFDQINTAYTVGKIGTNKVGISARCFEEENVESIMGILGGGGHKTCAATQFDNITLNKAKDLLLEAIKVNDDEIDIDKSMIKKPNT